MKLFKRLFGKLKTSHVVATFTKAVAQLEAVEAAHRAKAIKQRDKASAAELKASAAESEADLAARVRSKIADLVA